MLFPPVHNCDSVEKRRDVNVKDDDGGAWHETEDAVSPTPTPAPRRVVKNGRRGTASYTRMMARRVINRPQRRVCPGNECKSRGVLSRIALRLNIVRGARDISRANRGGGGTLSRMSEISTAASHSLSRTRSRRFFD